MYRLCCFYFLIPYQTLHSFAVIIRVKLHRKGDSQYLHTVKRFFAWHIEKVFREKPGEPVVMLFDMYGAGLGNLVSWLFVEELL